jgi:2,4-dienoyl-CoA reductase-like NADH-dependent reductase (Old Yellow Enzyme family)/thioredoxin reductase
MATQFPNLMQPLQIGSLRIRNRIVSTGHDTGLPDHGLVGDRLIAYQRARARGGAGLIVIQVASVHPTAFYTAHILQAHHDECIPGYRRLADAIHGEGGTTFGQLFHPGREILGSDDGTKKVAWSSSATPNERFHVKPRAMPKGLIDEVVTGYADAAARLIEAGVDGVEIVASHGYLPAQFLSAAVNSRQDEYGGNAENRVRFLREVLEAVRSRLGVGPVVGMRISGDDLDGLGLDESESTACCEVLAAAGLVDYVSVVAGSSASRPGAYHISAPMTEAHGYTAPYGAAVKARVSVPVIVTGRINQPQIAERIVAAGEADACGMTRAMICDPQLAIKTDTGRHEDVRACIACNQACVGHFFQGVPISCIQHPETGRELKFETLRPAAPSRRVLVAGGGPGGMKAAAVAAARGHEVTLCETGARLGGQALLAQLLPGRAEFGGIVTNLEREMRLAGVDVRLKTTVDKNLVELEKPDVVIVATGATPTLPNLPGDDEGHVVTAWDVLTGKANVGTNVVIADWRCDWIGYGIAEKLALDGCRVTLAVNGTQPGEEVMQYIRDHAAGRLFSLGVEVLPYARLYGLDADSVYFEHTMAREPMVCTEVDTLVLALDHTPNEDLVSELGSTDIEMHQIGDCLSPRTAEEAVFEGLTTAAEL